MSRDDLRLNAYVAMADDVVLRAQRLADLRLAAAVVVAPRLIVVEALLAGPPVPADRLDRAWVRRLKLTGDVILTGELAAPRGRRRADREGARHECRYTRSSDR